MIAGNNDPVVKGAQCRNCHGELRGFVVSTNEGKQAVYVCESTGCKFLGQVVLHYTPPAVTQPAHRPDLVE